MKEMNVTGIPASLFGFERQAIRAFYQPVQAYYPAEASVEQALTVIETGVVFLRAAKAW